MLNPTEVAPADRPLPPISTPKPGMAGVVGMPCPLRQVLSLVHSPGTRQMRLAGSPAGRCTVIPAMVSGDALGRC